MWLKFTKTASLGRKAPMFTTEQVQIITKVYKEFERKDNSTIKWNEVDDHMIVLSKLNKKQLFIEAKNIFIEHRKNKLSQNLAAPDNCLCTFSEILNSIEWILSHYEGTMGVPNKARYTVEYYLAISKTKDLYKL